MAERNFFLVAASLLLFSLREVAADQRPFFNIAHMVNSIKEVDYYLRLGANALEADVNFQQDGTAKQTYHGTPCDCFRDCHRREGIVDYLEYVRKISSLSDSKFKDHVALLFLDLKVSELPANSKEKAGKDIAKKLLDHLWYNVDPNRTVNVLLSIGHVSDKDVFKGAIETIMKNGVLELAERVGFDVGLNDPLEDIAKMYSELGIDHNRWQGDGVSNCLSLFRPAGRLREALRYRDARTDKNYADKVYHWTIDLTSAIRSSIRLGVDGIITNHPERVATVLNEGPFRKVVRPASPSDTPWKKVRADIPANTGGNAVLSVLGDVSEVFQQLWSYVVRRFTGKGSRSSRIINTVEGDPPMSPREKAEEAFYRWVARGI
ncbi:dermonecrotic toxin SPH-like [Ornithodoros turicata]|uniref:dermonecrotic toxin SPH-like n=1 Tax=Ornithodoros turicata TaxID=34597 RepID=UPI003139411E